jgi:DnaJ family protein C protein 17
MDELGKKLMKKDLYKFLGITETACDQEIKKAFRQKALSCHPDKTPDDPNAANLFREVTKACEILLDPSARKSYDKILKARMGVKISDPKVAELRRKLDEAEARAANKDLEEDEAKLAQEVERLIRRKNCEQLQKENELLKQEILKSFRDQETNSTKEVRVKISWEKKEINIGKVRELFSRFGSISDFVSKGTSALLVYSDSMSAVKATQSPLISGFTVIVLDPLPRAQHKTTKLSSDYEESVLEKMKRKASEKKEPKQESLGS